MSATTATRIEDGIEWYSYERDGELEEDCQCARCGSSAWWLSCFNCGGDGTDGHDCGEDCCACLHPEENVICDICKGKCGWYTCASGREWCEANPLPGREHIESAALHTRGAK